jgi:hypothetical protein
MKEQLGELRRDRRRFRPEKIWTSIIENKAANAAAHLTEASSASNVTALPYRTDAILAARAAADALDNVPISDAVAPPAASDSIDDVAVRRRAKFERLSSIAPEYRTEDEAAWLAVYEVYGDLGPNFGRVAS